MFGYGLAGGTQRRTAHSADAREAPAIPPGPVGGLRDVVSQVFRAVVMEVIER